MLSKLNNYYKSLDEISLTNSDLDTKREKLKSIIDTYHTQTQRIALDEKLLKQNEEMASMLTSTIGSLKTATDNWITNFKDMVEKEKFRSDLENYFIVIIFGKVKAGKSSLGNFIAHNRLSSQEINFFKYDETGKEQSIKKLEEIEEDSFKIANTECTTEIQGFKLSGMAWIDTPGLGSMVEENGVLARDYIQSADYIIYPLSSDGPEERDVMNQLKELFTQNKKVTICITKSDTIDQDEVDGKIVDVLVNKSIENRQEQENSLKKVIDKLLHDNTDSKLGNILSISVHTAKYGLENDDKEMFENSNITNFYELMTDVVQNKAKKLKENTPFDGLKSFVDNSILGNTKTENTLSIQNLKESIKKFENEIEEGIEKFSELQKNLDSDITVHVDSIISQYAGSLKSSGKSKNDFGFLYTMVNNGRKDNVNVSIFDTIDEELKKTISTMIDENINEILKNFSATLNNLTTTLSSTDNFNIEDKYETITVRYVDNSWYNPKGILGDEYSSESEKIKVGNNKQEVIANFKANRLESYIEVAKDNYQKIEEQFFTPLLNIAKEINTNIYNLENSVVEFKNNLK